MSELAAPFSRFTASSPRSIFVSAPDGLRLHVREYGPRLASAFPVVCLPGLARTAEDFEPLAALLADDPDNPRRVLALDYRGRGLSDYDRPANYTPRVELSDVLAALTALEVHRAVFVGSSRGGILTMLLAAAQPNRIVGAVLNDIGPVIEHRGLMRIKGYVGRLPQPRSFDEGAAILQKLFSSQFPRLPTEYWIGAARRTWRENKQRLQLAYDPKLSRALAGVDPERLSPKMWAQFDALAKVQVLVIRGALSDFLSADTVEEMCRRRGGNMQVLEVADEGHTPTLRDMPTLQRVSEFVRQCDTRR
jgi:pimeloyl-ACP methyl ester carboxylesterase